MLSSDGRGIITWSNLGKRRMRNSCVQFCRCKSWFVGRNPVLVTDHSLSAMLGRFSFDSSSNGPTLPHNWLLLLFYAFPSRRREVFSGNEKNDSHHLLSCLKPSSLTWGAAFGVGIIALSTWLSLIIVPLILLMTSFVLTSIGHPKVTWFSLYNLQRIVNTDFMNAYAQPPIRFDLHGRPLPMKMFYRRTKLVIFPHFGKFGRGQRLNNSHIWLRNHRGLLKNRAYTIGNATSRIPAWPYRNLPYLLNTSRTSSISKSH